jgi:cytochrome c biogenesis protein ResB
MSKTGKIILWIVIVIIVVGGIGWWMASRGGSPVAAPVSNNNSVGTAAVPSSTASGSQSTSYPQGDSDQSINQDMTNINTQMNGLSSDNASVTQSLNDQPVQQAE